MKQRFFEHIPEDVQVRDPSASSRPEPSPESDSLRGVFLGVLGVIALLALVGAWLANSKGDSVDVVGPVAIIVGVGASIAFKNRD